jgi:hypothetical protein
MSDAPLPGEAQLIELSDRLSISMCRSPQSASTRTRQPARKLPGCRHGAAGYIPLSLRDRCNARAY